MKVVLFSLILIASLAVHSQGLDQYDQEALQNTMNLLNDKSQRENSMRGDEAAQKVDKHVKQLAGSEEGTNSIYSLAADIFADIAKQSGGDVDKMNALIQEFQRDPAAFANKWSPEQKKKLKEISTKIKVPAANP